MTHFILPYGKIQTPSTNNQIITNIKIPISKNLGYIGDWLLFGDWNLGFGYWDLNI